MKSNASPSRGLAAIIVVVTLAACAGTPPMQDAVGPSASRLDVKRYGEMLTDAASLLRRGDADEAIAKDLDPVIAACDDASADSKPRIHGTRSLPEAIFHMANSITCPVMRTVLGYVSVA